MVLQSFGQISFDSQEDLEKAANEFFDQSEYAKAKPLFSQLLSKDALNPNYNYRFGVCILFTEQDPLKPLPYIEGGASTKGVNPEAYYFLGKAFQFNYRFDDAIAAYGKGKSAGWSRSGSDLDRSIEECRNGKILFNSAVDFQPAMDKEVIAEEFYRPYDFRKLKGKVIPMPPNFKTKYDEKNLLGTVIYTPSNSETLIYASYGEDGSNAKDLYRVNRLPNGEWALPQALPSTINTKYDEDYAFYDEESQTLFFASKGHNTMGGYDVFSSKYDLNSNKWSTPINLQFPVNSPFDDFLYVSDPEGKVAFFTSRRNSEEGKMRVFKTLLHDAQQVEVTVVEGTFFDKTDSIYNYAAVTVLDPLTKEVVGKYRSHKLTGKYLLILPPQNDYTLDVGPREADGFKFDFDVPQNDSYESLKQQLVYNVAADKGTVTLTNFFDATGNPDSVKFAESRSLKEVEAKMVAMPDPTALLAANAKISKEKAKAEQEAIAAAKAKEDAIKLAQEMALKQQAAEEAKQKAEAELAEEAKNEAIKQAELAKQREAEMAQAEKAKQDLLKQEEELALKKQKEAEETARLAQLSKQKEELRLDSIKRSKEAEVALQNELKTKDAAETARLAQLSKQKEELRLDSIKQSKEAEIALQNELKEKEVKEAMNSAKEKAKQDSIAQLADLALKKQEIERVNKEKEAARLDSLAEIDLALSELQDVAQAAVSAEAIEREFVQKALEKAKQDSVQEIERFNRLHASHLAARAKRDSVNKAIELAQLNEIKQKAKQDSVAAVELAIEQERLTKLKLLDDQENLLAQIEFAETKAALAILEAEQKLAAKEVEKQANPEVPVSKQEEEQLAKIDQEVELEVQKAQSESAIVVEPSEDPVVSKTGQLAEKKDSTEPKQENNMAEESSVDVELAETAVVSESELFLQTIAKLEAQKKQQDELVKAENEERQKAKESKQPQKAVDPEKALVESSTASQTDAVSPSGTKIGQESTPQKPESVALKSDVKPEDYLAALNEIENAIADEAKARPDKDYTLRTIEARAAEKGNETLDPVLQAKIAADRQALAEHQKIAVEKEKALREQMSREKGNIENVVLPTNEELQVSEAKENITQTADVEIIEEPVVEAVQVEKETPTVVNPAKPNEEKVAEVKTETAAIVELAEPTVEVTTATDEVTEAAVEKVESDAVEVTAFEATNDAPVETELLTELAELDELEAEAEKTLMVDSLDQKDSEIAKVEEEKQVAVEEKSEVNDDREIPVVAYKVKPAPVVEAIKREDGVGAIPFMTAALRNYSTRKPSFEKVEDPQLKRMVQRMRSEDIGRLAVLKNMKNDWVDAGKSAESLKQIKENRRNQDVLESVVESSSREEIIRPPFNRNDLKVRKDVCYKLEFGIKTSNLSETIYEAMNPELAISFAMPEFNLQSAHYLTLADATSGFNEYRGRGFERIKIVPYLKNERVALSDVTNIPFVD